MSLMEVILVATADCGNCERIRRTLSTVHHDFRHVDVREVDADAPEGRSLAVQHGILMLPAIIVGDRLRLVGEISEKEIRHEIEKAQRHNRR